MNSLQNIQSSASNANASNQQSFSDFLKNKFNNQLSASYNLLSKYKEISTTSFIGSAITEGIKASLAPIDLFNVASFAKLANEYSQNLNVYSLDSNDISNAIKSSLQDKISNTEYLTLQESVDNLDMDTLKDKTDTFFSFIKESLEHGGYFSMNKVDFSKMTIDQIKSQNIAIKGGYEANRRTLLIYTPKDGLPHLYMINYADAKQALTKDTYKSLTLVGILDINKDEIPEKISGEILLAILNPEGKENFIKEVLLRELQQYGLSNIDDDFYKDSKADFLINILGALICIAKTQQDKIFQNIPTFMVETAHCTTQDKEWFKSGFLDQASDYISSFKDKYNSEGEAAINSQLPSLEALLILFQRAVPALILNLFK